MTWVYGSQQFIGLIYSRHKPRAFWSVFFCFVLFCFVPSYSYWPLSRGRNATHLVPVVWVKRFSSPAWLFVISDGYGKTSKSGIMLGSWIKLKTSLEVIFTIEILREKEIEWNEGKSAKYQKPFPWVVSVENSTQNLNNSMQDFWTHSKVHHHSLFQDQVDFSKFYPYAYFNLWIFWMTSGGGKSKGCPRGCISRKEDKTLQQS
jgi:hypothetical protein